ncbi:MAG: hypothetical protein ACTHNK_12945 [Thermomicrobiales bacterium]
MMDVTTLERPIGEVEQILHEIGGDVGEVPNLTREHVVPRKGRAPLVLIPTGLSLRRRERMIAAALMRELLTRCDYQSLTTALAKIFQCTWAVAGLAVAYSIVT